VKLIELAPDQSIAHYKWAIVKEYDGDLPAARQELLMALQLQPDFAPALDSLGGILMQMHEPQEAMRNYLRAITLDPDFAEAHNHYAYALQIVGRFDEAIDQYRIALRLDPSLTPAKAPWRHLGGE
jgi:tetratricopeptide (TPR) repeat protein